MKNILITGGAGFIGSHVVDAFLQRGYKVSVIDKKETKYFQNVSKNLSFYKVDLNNVDEIKAVIRREEPQIISHHASELVGVKESIINPRKSFQDIFLAPNLFESAKNSTVKQIIFSSSANVYDKNSSIPINEHAPVNPLSPYGISKLSIETYCSYLEQMWGMKFTIFRYFNVYGPRQPLVKNAGIIPVLIGRALKDEEVVIYGTGKQSRDFIYVKDVACANLLSAEKNISGIFNVGSMQEVSVNKLIEVIEEILNKKIRIKYKSGPYEIERSVADNSKLKKYINWQPEVGIVEGLKETIKYYEDEL